MLTWLGSGESLLTDTCLLAVSSSGKGRVSSPGSFLIRALILLDQGSTLAMSFNLITSLKALLPNIVTLRVRASAYKFGGGHHSQEVA